MTRVLGFDESLTLKRMGLSLALDRPVYVISMPGVGGMDCRYKQPDEVTYRPRGGLDLALGEWSEGPCVQREDHQETTIRRNGQVDVIPPHTIRKFDLKPANLLYLAFPSRKEDTRAISNVFATVGLHTNLNALYSVRVQPEEVPVELRSYVREVKTGAGSNRKSIVEFHVSEAIVRPTFRRLEWHPGVTTEPSTFVEASGYDPIAFTTIHPPGLYPDNTKFTFGEDWNRMVVCVRKPGPCIACHGASGEWRHLGSLTWADRAYAAGLVCRSCLPTATEQWKAILDNLEVPCGAKQ